MRQRGDPGDPPASPPPADGRAPARTASAAESLALTTAIQALVSVALIAPASVAPLVLGSLGLPSAAIGVYITLVYVGAIVSSLLGSHEVMHRGPIRTSQFGLLLCAAGLLLVAVGNAAVAAAGAVLIGLGYGPITPASSQILAKTTPPHRMSLVFSVKQTGVPLGGVIAGFVAPPLALAIGWPGALAAFALACVACAAPAQRLRASLDADLLPAGRRPGFGVLLGRPLRVALAVPALRTIAACSFVFSAVQVSLTAYVVADVNTRLRWTLVAAGAALSVAQVAGVAGRVLWGWLADRGLGARRVLLGLNAAMVACGVAMALVGPATPSALVLAILAVYGGSAIGWNGVYLAAVARLAPAGQAGLATGGTLAFTFLGVVVGPALFGAIASAGAGFGLAYAATALPLVACLAALYRLRERPQAQA